MAARTAAAVRLATARHLASRSRLWGGADCNCAAPAGTAIRRHAAQCRLRRGVS